MGRYSQDTGGGDFQQAPAGSHIARCIRIIDLGTQTGEYQGQATTRNQIIVQWELPAETMEIDGEQKPLLVSKFYTNSLSEKANLRKDLESWRARQFSVEELMRFDLETILGKPCMLSIVHNEKGKAKVQGVSGLPKGTTCPPAYNEPSAFWINESPRDEFEALSDGFKRIIMASPEYQKRYIGSSQRAAQAEARTHSVDDDDIPFSWAEHDGLKNMLQVQSRQAAH